MTRSSSATEERNARQEVHVALGSNLKNRKNELERAVSLMARIPDTRITRRSPIYETTPEGPSERLYLNMVVELSTTLTPRQLLDALLNIESEMGRIRTARWADRNIDLDLVLWGDRVVDSKRLQIPHPRMHRREFVLRPLCDLAPDAVHPLLGRSIMELLAALGACTARRIDG